MADLDDDVVSELYELIACRYCLNEYPAISLHDHEALCKSKPGNLNAEELAFMYEAGMAPEFDLDAALDGDDDKNLFVDTECKICNRTFPKISITKHEAMCHLFIEQQAAAAAFERLNREKSVKDIDQNISKKESSDTYAKVIDSPKIEIETSVLAGKDEKRNESFQSESFSPKKTKFKAKEEIKEIPDVNEQKRSEKIQLNLTKQFSAKESKIDEVFPKVQVPKVPKIPLLDCIDQTDDTEDLNNLSDDDCGESLEDFWNRARDLLQRRRQQNL